MSDKYFDVVIVGAGLSGIGAACHLQERCPGKSYAILEGRDSMGGTWDLFRYPGIRSDSDMHTLGYSFKPWEDAKSIADGPSILNYVKETAAENQIEEHIRYNRNVTRAAWSSQDACWTVTVHDGSTGETGNLRCAFLLMCSGYFSYEQGYTPKFEGREQFKGKLVHPQHWPEDLDYRDRKVIIIGSGATAVTLAPAMAEQARQVIMLQRSPTYVVSRPDTDAVANFLRKVLPHQLAYEVTRWKNVLFQQFIYNRSRKQPEKLKRHILKLLRKELGPDYDIETHFTPSYYPWDQRLCLVPNSDLFRSIRSGRTAVVTEHIDRFTENGILLKSGEQLEADIIVTATGLNLVPLGGIEFTVDDQPVNLADTFTYKGIMCSGVPNLVQTFGYINASWTLRADLTAEFACRLINRMERTGQRQCTPRLNAEERRMSTRPWIDDFSSGYMQRMLHLFPRQGDREPWTNPQNYKRDKKLLRHGALDDGALEFSNPEPELSTEVVSESS